MLQAMSNIILQANHTNQALLNFLATQGEIAPKVRPRPFSGLPTEDVLLWLDHFDNVASYHGWSDHRKALETRTLMDNVAATWFLQLPEEAKNNWVFLKAQLIQSFAHQNITQTALQQLTTLRQQQSKPVAQFAVKLNQLLLRVDPTMSEEMKLFFLWPRLRHDLSRRVRDQGPTSLLSAINIAQRIESASNPEPPVSLFSQPLLPRPHMDTTPSPMDIDVQNAQMTQRRPRSDRDAQGRPRCFFCNNYGHVKRHCRKFQSQQQHQNVQVKLADAASLAELPGNV